MERGDAFMCEPSVKSTFTVPSESGIQITCNDEFNAMLIWEILKKDESDNPFTQNDMETFISTYGYEAVFGEGSEQNVKRREEVIYTLADLNDIFPFGKSKLLKLCKTGALPVIKVGKDYISSPKLVDRWMQEHEGKEIIF